MSTHPHENRTVIAITGTDSEKFLQDLVSNDVTRAGTELVYAALLSAQGKYLYDFFLTRDDRGFLLDIAVDDAPKLAQRLNMYKLRADVEIAGTDINVTRGLGQAPDGALADPRHTALGWRKYSSETVEAENTDWDAIRVAHCIPEAGIELISDSTYILEAGFERLSGVDFRKGCYVGQEVTARMKHKTELRKGFATVAIVGSAPIGTDIISKGKVVGQIYTQSGDRAIAYLRFDRASDDMTAGDAQIKYYAPA
jgi:folate-binding protein YgfZ